MKRDVLQFRLLRKAVSLGVLVAFLAADFAYAAPFCTVQRAKLAPASRSETKYQEERDAAAMLVQARRTTVINYVCSVISVAVLSFLMLMTPLNAEARSSKKAMPRKPDTVAAKTTVSKKKLPARETLSIKEEPATLTQVVMSYINDMTKTVRDGFHARAIAALRKEADANVRLGIDTCLFDPFQGFLQDIAFPLDRMKRVSSEFGPRKSPTTGASSDHKGTDLTDKSGEGAPIYALMGGTVEVVVDKFTAGINQGSGYGNVVKIRDVRYGKNVEVRYGHLKRVYVAKGERVEAGVLVADEGTTGTSTGPHLHLEVIIDGQHINPAFFFDDETLKEWGAAAGADKREAFERKYIEALQLRGSGITLETAPRILDLYGEVFKLMGLDNEAGKLNKAKESLLKIKKEVEAAAAGEKGADPQKAIDDFLKYLGMIFGAITFSSLKKREEEKLEGAIGELIETGTATPEAVNRLIDRAVERISEWVGLRGSYIQKLRFSADQLRMDLEGWAAKIVAANAPPAQPAETNSDVATAASPDDAA